MTKDKPVETLQPIFVVGPPRSGTTLTARILGRHSRIFMPGETHFFDDIYARRRELGALSDPASLQKVVARLSTIYGRYDENPDQRRIDKLLQMDGLLEKLISCEGYKALFSCFMEFQMKSMGKKRWGNNVPKDIFHVEDILSFYPDAKFIVCVRDIRDFLISYKNKWKNTGEQNVDRIRKLYHPVVTSLLWKASVKQILRIRDLIPSENLILIRYETLVQNPETLVREICQFIGEDFEADMLSIDDENSSFDINEKGIYSSSVGRWCSLLTNEEVYIAERISGSHLLEFGYLPAKSKPNVLKIGHIFVTLPYGLWQALRANKAIRGPLLPYAFRRFVALSHISMRRNTAGFSRHVDNSPLRGSH